MMEFPASLLLPVESLRSYGARLSEASTAQRLRLAHSSVETMRHGNWCRVCAQGDRSQDALDGFRTFLYGDISFEYLKTKIRQPRPPFFPQPCLTIFAALAFAFAFPAPLSASQPTSYYPFLVYPGGHSLTSIPTNVLISGLIAHLPFVHQLKASCGRLSR